MPSEQPATASDRGHGIGPYSEEELDDYGRTYEYYCPKGCWQELARNTDAPNSPTGLPKNPDCPECGWRTNIGNVRCRYGEGYHAELRSDGGYPHADKDLTGGPDGSARTPCCFEEVETETTHSDSGRPSGSIWRCPECGEEWQHPTETIGGPWGDSA